MLRTYPGLLVSAEDLVRAINPTTYHARKNDGLLERFAKGVFVADSVLDDDNRRPIFIYGWRQLLWDRVLVDGFVATDDIIKGSPSFRGGPQDCSSGQVNGLKIKNHRVRAPRYLGEDAQCALRGSRW